MDSYEKLSLMINSLIALGLFSIALTALCGSWIKRKLFPARLTVELLDKNGELTILDNGHRVIYYHLRIINKKSVIVSNCRVYLKKIRKLAASGQYEEVPLSVPPRYFWSPSETMPEGIDVVNEHVIDFGYVIDNSKVFKPTVTPILNSFKGNLQQNQTFRYYIEIIAENYRPRKLTCIEVHWNGEWPEDLNEMHKSLIIRKI